MEKEGVIKYRLAFKSRNLKPDYASLAEINCYRQKMLALGLIGQDNTRYEGYGFGNISLRCKKGNESFWISGTQTGHIPMLSASHLCLVTQTYPEKNTVVAQGQIKPSSESMTHSVLYQLDEQTNAVIHIHSPDIWHKSTKLGLPATPAEIPYGTPQMAKAVKQLASLRTARPIVFSMRGHEDGIVAAGQSLDECATAIINILERTKDYI